MPDAKPLHVIWGLQINSDLSERRRRGFSPFTDESIVFIAAPATASSGRQQRQGTS